MGNQKRIKNEKKDKQIDEEKFKSLLNECKLEYPETPEIILHTAILHYMMNGSKPFKCETDKAFNQELDEAIKDIKEQKGSMTFE